MFSELRKRERFPEIKSQRMILSPGQNRTSQAGGRFWCRDRAAPTTAWAAASIRKLPGLKYAPCATAWRLRQEVVELNSKVSQAAFGDALSVGLRDYCVAAAGEGRT